MRLLHTGNDFDREEPSATPSDRKSTRLNSSHITISYAVFCLKKKKKKKTLQQRRNKKKEKKEKQKTKATATDCDRDYKLNEMKGIHNHDVRNEVNMTSIRNV